MFQETSFGLHNFNSMDMQLGSPMLSSGISTTSGLENGSHSQQFNNLSSNEGYPRVGSKRLREDTDSMDNLLNMEDGFGALESRRLFDNDLAMNNSYRSAPTSGSFNNNAFSVSDSFISNSGTALPFAPSNSDRTIKYLGTSTDGSDGDHEDSSSPDNLNGPPRKKTHRSERDRQRHNAVERKRKQSIKVELSALGDLVPNKGSKQTHWSILRSAVDYINELRDSIENLQHENRDLKSQHRLLMDSLNSMNAVVASNGTTTTSSPTLKDVESGSSSPDASSSSSPKPQQHMGGAPSQNPMFVPSNSTSNSPNGVIRFNPSLPSGPSSSNFSTVPRPSPYGSSSSAPHSTPSHLNNSTPNSSAISNSPSHRLSRSSPAVPNSPISAQNLMGNFSTYGDANGVESPSGQGFPYFGSYSDPDLGAVMMNQGLPASNPGSPQASRNNYYGFEFGQFTNQNVGGYSRCN